MLITKPNLGLEVTASAPFAVKLALLGTLGGTHIGGSFARGAAKLGIKSIWFDADKASAGPRLLRSLSWHLADRRPLHLNRFSNELVDGLRTSQARDSYRDRHGAIDRIGAARLATIGHRQRELFDRRSLESGHAVELASAGIALL